MTARTTAINTIANHRVASTQNYLEHAGADIYGGYSVEALFGEALAAAPALRREHPALYELLRGFYRQDPAGP